MNNGLVITIVVIVGVLFAIFAAYIVMKKMADGRSNKMADLAHATGYSLIETKYGSGLETKYKGRPVIIALAVRDAGTIHISISQLMIYMETDWRSGTEHSDLDMPKNMYVADGDKILKGSTLDLLIEESSHSKWSKQYIATTPSSADAESISARLEEMYTYVTGK